MMSSRWMAVACCVVAGSACGQGGEAQALADTTAAGAEAAAREVTCTPLGGSMGLPDAVRETSGLAQGQRDPSRFWTHNDAGNDAEIYALDAEGRLVQRVRIAGAEATDWEDIEGGRCESGACLFIGDIGDNDAERERITVYQLPEPVAGVEMAEPVSALHARYPDGPRDAESLFRLASGELFLVTKGRRGPVELYRLPASVSGAGEPVVLARVRVLFPEPDDELDRVTAASASPDGRWVGVRSYRNLFLYRADELTGTGPVEATVVDLTPLGHGQGESIVITDDGVVWLSSEAENRDAQAEWARLQCSFPTLPRDPD